MLPWLKEVWMYFTAQILMLAYYGTWASARTLFTYCVHENEIGKIYASVGIVASIAPLLSNPAYRTLYNLVRDHPYIMLAYFWAFSDPPTMSATLAETELLYPKNAGA